MTLPSKETLAYFAGILDGEGTFTVIVVKHRHYDIPWHRGLKRTGRGFQLVPNMSFVQKSKPMVDWAKETLGGIVYSRNVGGMYGWRIQRLDALTVLIPQLLPYLRLKKEQAKVVLGFAQHRQAQEVTDGNYQAPYDDICFELAERVRLLNNGKHKYSAGDLKKLYDDVAV